MKRKLIVISEDAMVREDLELLKQLPSFGAFCENGARVDTLRSIYPTITYPVHTSVATGVYPEKHGLVNNTPPRCKDWYWFADAYSVPNIFAAAKKAGLSTAAVFWPVTGNDPNIDYLVDEYWSQTPDDPIEDVFSRSGSSPDVMEKIVRPNLPLLEGKQRQHPQADEFVHACACAIIREYQPDLLMIHPANIDGVRHKCGLFGPLVDHHLHLTDRWLGWIVEATKLAGTYDDTDFVIISDHGQMNISRVVHLNAILREHGLIRTDADGNVESWDAWVDSVGLSAHVYLQDPRLVMMQKKVGALLHDLAKTGAYGFTEFYTADEIREKEHLAGGFSFVVESDGYTTFGNDYNMPAIRAHDVTDYRTGRATHGMLPDRGPQPTMIACGPSFRKGAVVGRRPIVDVTATLARILGIEMDGIDGSVIEDILK